MNPLKCLLMPRRASRTIALQGAEIERLNAESEQLAKQNSELKADCTTLSESLHARQQQINALDNQNEQMRKEIIDLRERLEAAEVDEREYKEVVEMVDRFTELKQSYDKKIAALRRRLDEARQLLAQRSATHRQLTDIGFGDDSSDLTEDADWLRQLPE